MRVKPKQQTAIRLVAFLGAVNAIFFFVYNLPAQAFAVHGDT